ncbi:glutathione S-transferase family protein [Rhodovarius crocodyli]|uniref:Glutathione S-transferase family protein n=1 Tax=Rhodovarius crocodyli TaxID=1979269 RepID=A0A437MDZ2_9PROT|nr:glutathione S-transferase family protein [Rhodovarius crocodyli]RVT95880.1 glutathione S-transferase family protein [Rhodovarius crocodyli]
MSRLLYELAGEDPGRRFSPYCWRTRFALAHKGLEAEGTPWRFTEKDRLAFSGQGLVPVLVDGDTVLSDSWRIAEWLEEKHPDRPSLFGGAPALVRFVNSWADTALHPALARLIIMDIHGCLAPADQAYFRQTREARFGASLEAIQAKREVELPAFRKLLQPLRGALAGKPWLGGDTPNYADYIVLGSFQWARCTSPFRLLAEDDVVFDWRARGFALFDGMAAKAKGYTA